MSPILKYSLARLGLFVAVAAVLFVLPVDVSPLLKLMIAVLVSMVLSFFLLRAMRDQVTAQAMDIAQRRAQRKERLRAALNGDDDGQGAGKES